MHLATLSWLTNTAAHTCTRAPAAGWHSGLWREAVWCTTWPTHAGVWRLCVSLLQVLYGHSSGSVCLSLKLNNLWRRLCHCFIWTKRQTRSLCLCLLSLSQPCPSPAAGQRVEGHCWYVIVHPISIEHNRMEHTYTLLIWWRSLLKFSIYFVYHVSDNLWPLWQRKRLLWFNSRM